MKKRILQFGMTAKAVMIALLLGVAGMTNGYAQSFTVGNLRYTVNSDGVSVTVNGLAQGVSASGSLVIPNEVAYNGTSYPVTVIANNAFQYKSGFSGFLTIGSSVTTIGSYAFYNCSGFTGSLYIPNSVTTIGEYAFYNCYGFTGSLTIGNSVTTIGNFAFYGLWGFTGNLTIGNSVATIGNSAFENCSRFTGSLNIPNSVATIGNRAFFNCYGFKGNLGIGNSVIYIGEWTFSSCSGFTGELVIPNSVNTIGNEAFQGCSGFSGSLNIPISVIMIGQYAFSGCKGLEQIVVDSGNVVYDSRENCNAIIKTNENELIAGCQNTVIPNTVTTIGNGAFFDCSNLTGNLNIPNSVTAIGSNAFDCCTGLTGNLTIPNSVTTIGGCAFRGCSGLTKALMLGTTPPSLGGSVFISSSFPIYVPYESVNDYQTATNWSSYENRIFPMTYKTISAHSENGGWNFIASPLAENTAPTEIDDMVPTTGTYDLYRFDQTENAEWRNYKANNFNLVNGQGYLYANAEDVNLIFKGTFNEDETKNVELVYDANASFAGWNLVGNPFPVSAYANKSYYTMNEDGSAIEPVAVSMETAIPACTGVMVKAENTGESVTFSKTAPETQGQNNGSLQIAVAQANTRGASTSSAAILDKAVVSFNEGDELGKFVFNKDNAKLYIPQGNEEYAIAYAAKQGEMPLNFEATENGEYTISIKAENAEFGYLHLIDNLTGADIDLLPLCKGGKGDSQPATYTFIAKTTDYASRFRLLFSVSGDADGDDGAPFAFINNGSIIVSDANADATLQIVDMTGHIIVSADVARNISTNGMAQGVYVLRLIKGDEVKTQRIVVE